MPSERRFIPAHALDAWLFDLEDDPDPGQRNLSHLARAYCNTPRCLLWPHPSRDWRLILMLLPMTSRLGLLRNPIFAQLVRTWGTHLRVIGIDHDHQVRNFNAVLSDEALSFLLTALAQRPAHDDDHVLDIVLAAADAHFDDCHDDGLDQASVESSEGTQVAERRLNVPLLRQFDLQPGHGLPLGIENPSPWLGQATYGAQQPEQRGTETHPERRDSLFDRSGRYPELLGALQQQLLAKQLPQERYIRILAGIASRESIWEHQIAARIHSELHQPLAQALTRRRPSSPGLHLGVYNWLLLDPSHQAQRLNAVRRLPTLAPWFAEHLLRLHDPFAPPLAQHDLRARANLPSRRELDPWIQQAIDSGQDRLLLRVLADRFAVDINTLRRLWHERPAALEGLPSWQIPTVLHKLDDDLTWPQSALAWADWLQDCIPYAAQSDPLAG